MGIEPMHSRQSRRKGVLERLPIGEPELRVGRCYRRLLQGRCGHFHLLVTASRSVAHGAIFPWPLSAGTWAMYSSPSSAVANARQYSSSVPLDDGSAVQGAASMVRGRSSSAFKIDERFRVHSVSDCDGVAGLWARQR